MDTAITRLVLRPVRLTVFVCYDIPFIKLLVPLSLKRKHSEPKPEAHDCSVPLSSIPVPPSVPKKTKPCLPTKRICLSLPNKSLSDNAKKETLKLQPVSGDVAKVFGQDEESEEEEMPMEARIRMRNKGRVVMDLLIEEPFRTNS
ncbi:hypothetical protein TcWFU_008014 [Taenia crassiceps]|uniref:PEST proteolytic signal-containing nuclear protein n=1 Tax=Taenia crassiceps TaxID=6207 RepID=A0ABR4QC61_9CEST